MKMKTVQLLLLLFVAIGNLFAQSSDPLRINGIYYNLNERQLEAEVVKGNLRYRGTLEIPEELEVNGQIYHVTSIGAFAFDGATEVSSITIPTSVVKVGGLAFFGCTGLTTITLPDSLTTIGVQAFANCTSLRTATLPRQLSSLGIQSFAGCTKLTDVYCLAEIPPHLGAEAFDENTIPYATLHVLSWTVDLYREASFWKNFGRIVAIDGIQPDPKCATPTISYADGHLSFECETDDVLFVSSISNPDIGRYSVSDISLSVTYTIEVKATRKGFKDSETATAVLCWLKSEPETTGLADGIEAPLVSRQSENPVLIRRQGQALVVSGALQNALVHLFDIEGRKLASGRAAFGEVCLPLPRSSKGPLILKVGEQMVKVAF